VAALSNAWVCCGSLAGIAGSNPARGIDVFLCECCVLSSRGLGLSLVHMSPTESGVSECDLETSTMRRPWPTRAVEQKKKIMIIMVVMMMMIIIIIIIIAQKVSSSCNASVLNSG
jgi:hypothetical protein